MKKTEESPKELIFLTKSNNDNSPFKILEQIEPQNEYNLLNNMINSPEIIKSSKSSFINNKIKFFTKKKKIFSVSNKRKKKENKKNNNNHYSKGRWTKEERNKFAYALNKYGTDWKKISTYVSTRSSIQIISHAQKFLSKLISNEYIIQKGLDIKDLNWENCFKCLKENLSDSELSFVLTSIECEIGDNKRITSKYLERKSSMIKNNNPSLKEGIRFITSDEKNNDNNPKNEINILKEDTNKININEFGNDFDKLNSHKKDIFLEMKNEESDNNLLFHGNFNLFSFDNINIFDNNNE